MAEHHSPEGRERIVAAITAFVAHDFPRASAEFQEMIVAEIVMAAGDPRSPLHRAFVKWAARMGTDRGQTLSMTTGSTGAHRRGRFSLTNLRK
jgi:hypothetical protein